MLLQSLISHHQFLKRILQPMKTWEDIKLMTLAISLPLLMENHISNDAFIFINRLSDLLFAIGRFMQTKILGEREIIYKKH
jgi:hypothetical protein